MQAIYSPTTVHILDPVGDMSMRRVSHVEPDEHQQWWADLSPVGGPKLGPFPADAHAAALAAEIQWLNDHLSQPRNL